MIYFLDTNIHIGYVFFEDPWHEKSLDIFNHEKLYWSVIVKKEFDKKFTEFSDIFYSYISKIELKLSDYSDELITLNNFNKILLNISVSGMGYKKRNRILKRIWESITQNEECISKSSLLNEIKKYKMSMRSTYFSRRKHIINKLHLFNSDSLVYSLIDKLEGIHSPDNKIILDAHYLASICDEEIYFVSADGKLCKKARSFDFLEIAKFCQLDEFV